MTMVDSNEIKYKEFHCGMCEKFMGYINTQLIKMQHDFLCSTKCQVDFEKQEKKSTKDLLFGRPESKEKKP